MLSTPAIRFCTAPAYIGFTVRSVRHRMLPSMKFFAARDVAMFYCQEKRYNARLCLSFATVLFWNSSFSTAKQNIIACVSPCVGMCACSCVDVHVRTSQCELRMLPRMKLFSGARRRRFLLVPQKRRFHALVFVFRNVYVRAPSYENAYIFVSAHFSMPCEGRKEHDQKVCHVDFECCRA